MCATTDDVGKSRLTLVDLWLHVRDDRCNPCSALPGCCVHVKGDVVRPCPRTADSYVQAKGNFRGPYPTSYHLFVQAKGFTGRLCMTFTDH